MALTTITIKWEKDRRYEPDGYVDRSQYTKKKRLRQNKKADKLFKDTLKLYMKQLKKEEIKSMDYFEVNDNGDIYGTFKIER